ncbi:MAG TPA: DUF3416 domain-containing protein, partial [Candidatus Agrococcus pullicola]|nr:DUF3416 domain-containing protein [Candidatus Agrococcus pullicola]
MDGRAGSVENVNAKLNTVTGRILIDELTPRVPGGKFPAKAVVGEVVPFEATVFREGHDALGVRLTLIAPDGSEHEHPMELIGPGTDRFRAVVQMDAQGEWSWFVTAFHDEWATWMHDARIKIGAGVDSELMLQIGAAL